MEWVSMFKQLETRMRSLCAMPGVGWSGVKHATTGLWSRGNESSGGASLITEYQSAHSGNPKHRNGA